MTAPSVRIHYHSLGFGPEIVRHGEPVTVGIPWPRGAVESAEQLRVLDRQGQVLVSQASALDHWPDGSVRWALLDWLAESGTEVDVTADPSVGDGHGSPLTARETSDGFEVDTGLARFRLRPRGYYPFDSVEIGGGSPVRAEGCGVSARDDANCRYRGVVDRIEIEDAGPVRVTVRTDGRLVAAGGSALLDLRSRLHFFRSSACVRVDLTVTNRRAAGHPGGIWTLGGDGSVYLRDLSLSLAASDDLQEAVVRLSPEPGEPLAPIGSPLELYQASSGGENWQSPAHVDRSGEIPLPFRGYRLRAAGDESQGQRATPIVELAAGEARLAMSAPELWQNFPKAIEAAPSGIIVRLFPRQQQSCHEIQGGERKTHTLWLALGPDRVSGETLAWSRQPLLAHAEPAWYASSGAVPFLSPESDDPNRGYRDLVALALEGDDTLEAKREAVDEYGWRHFGDVWADHESARDPDDAPFISHYNNQYDMVGGFAIQFLRSVDARWWTYMSQLARHVRDIDIYHTDRDKSAYNGGMFWHTVHYVKAGESTHRSYPRAEGVHGGGPSSGHLYSGGLWRHYLLTGDRDSREAVIGLGDYVLGADDGARTIFRFLDRGATGHVSNSGFDEYHGPGRSAANAIAALVYAHRATERRRYLDKADELLRRCVHPHDRIDALDLLDADRKWFYTMFLQSLADYLDYKAELGELDASYAYGRAALLHYAEWAAEHEYPYLDKPEILEFPTETWAAQDMRKSEMFRAAARFAGQEARVRLLERGRFFFDAAVERLGREATRSYSRPLALMLSYGWAQAWFDRNDPEPMSEPAASEVDFGEPSSFVSQKRRALGRAKRIAVGAWATAVIGLGIAALLLWLQSR